jgi:ATP-dependent protease ClpP protease subunit
VTTDYRERVALLQRQGVNDWFKIENKAGSKSARIRLFDEIGFFGTTAKDFAAQLDDLDVEHIELHINSIGGEVTDSVTIMNVLRDHPAKVTTIIDGVAASAASFIALAGDEVVMNRHSQIMIHDAWGLAMGNSADMTDLAARLDKESDSIASIYAEKAGGTIAEWRERMRAETWFYDQEAVDVGLADRVAADVDATEAKNRHNFVIFNYAGREKAPNPPISTKKDPAATADGETKQKGPNMSDLMGSLRQKLGIADESADEATVLAALDEALAEQVAPPAPQLQNSAEPQDLEHLKKMAEASGAVIVDKGNWEDLQAKIQQGVSAAQKLREQERDFVLNRAVEDGRIPPASRATWAALYDNDPKATADVIDRLVRNSVPVAAMGYSLEGDENDLGEFSALFPKGA